MPHRTAAQGNETSETQLAFLGVEGVNRTVVQELAATGSQGHIQQVCMNKGRRHQGLKQGHVHFKALHQKGFAHGQ